MAENRVSGLVIHRKNRFRILGTCGEFGNHCAYNPIVITSNLLGLESRGYTLNKSKAERPGMAS